MADVRGQAGVSSRDQIQRPGLSGYPREGGARQVPRGTCSLGSPSGLYVALTFHFIAEPIETQGNGAKSWEQSLCPHSWPSFLPRGFLSTYGGQTRCRCQQSPSNRSSMDLNLGVGKGREGGSLFTQQTLVY